MILKGSRCYARSQEASGGRISHDVYETKDREREGETCVCVRIYLKCTNEWMYMDMYMHCTCEYARIRMYLTYTQGLSTTLLLPQATLKPNFFRPEESSENRCCLQALRPSWFWLSSLSNYMLRFRVSEPSGCNSSLRHKVCVFRVFGLRV